MPKEINSVEIRHDLEKVLGKKRYEHTLGVAYTAMNLASLYNEDIDKAFIAGLLHDCAKKYEDEELVKICKDNDLPMSIFEKKHGYLLHGRVGAFFAKTKYGVDDEDILNAITYHTTGRPGMSPLEKIIYIADYIEPLRKPLPNLSEARKKAFCDLDDGLLFITESVLDYLKESGKEIDEASYETYKFYSKEN